MLRTLAHFSLSVYFCICNLFGSRTPACPQTETYQIANGGPTHGTDGPIKVSRVMSLKLGDQYLQVAAALDPTRARAPPDTDTNDLKTIDVYTVRCLCYNLAPCSNSMIS